MPNALGSTLKKFTVEKDKDKSTTYLWLEQFTREQLFPKEELIPLEVQSPVNW